MQGFAKARKQSRINMADHYQLSNFIWQIADLLRGPYRPPQYERVMLPFTLTILFPAAASSCLVG
jgi:type I restriction-modification system DNA methylase subunit